MKQLIPFFSSHQTFSEGGRKCHIGVYEDGKALCGNNHTSMTSSGEEVTPEWVLHGIRSRELCVKCARKAVLIFESEL